MTKNINKGLVSIIIPVYNVEKYIDRCVESLLNQTYKNIEIILVDDGSIDKSSKMCDEYKKRDNRVVVFHKKNGGVSSARNIGIDVATGYFITFIDGDDYVSNEYIETLLRYQEKNDYDIVVGNAIDFDEFNNQNQFKRLNSPCVLNTNEGIIEFFKCKLFTPVCWGNLYKTENVKKSCFDESMRIAEDGKFLYSQLNLSNNIIVIPELMYFYYIRSTSVVHSGFSEKFYDELNFCKELIELNSEFYKLKKLAYKKYIDFLFRLINLDNIPATDYTFVINEISKIKLSNLSFKDVLKVILIKIKNSKRSIKW